VSTLYDRIGGRDAIADLVADFYERVLADPELKPFFTSASIKRLQAMQLEFFITATGGPQTYSGLAVRDAHAGRGIGPRQLTLFVDHLVASLQTRGLDRDDIDEIVRRIGLAADDVIGGATDTE
jgi:hemoglobin